MRACWLKWVGRDWSISADYIWLNYSDANSTYCHGLDKSSAEGNNTKYISPAKQA